jgi:predicted Ser/Thr protein kinase
MTILYVKLEAFEDPIAISTLGNQIGEELTIVGDVVDEIRSRFLLPRYCIPFINIDGGYRIWSKSFLLSDFDLSTVTESNPIILKQSHIQIWEYRKCLLPFPRYSSQPINPNSTATDNFLPEVVLWGSFVQDVNQWIGSNLDVRQHMAINEPSFSRRSRITEEVSGLQPFIFDNVLSIANDVFPAGLQFGHQRDSDQPNLARPDYLLMVNHKTPAAPVEVKGEWTLKEKDIVEKVNRGDPHVISAVTQILRYMNTYKRKFGILTSYENTWFLRRQVKDGKEYLEISEGISYAQSNPTLIEAIVYFANIVTIEDIPRSLTYQLVDEVSSESANSSMQSSSGTSITTMTRAQSDAKRSTASKDASGRTFTFQDFTMEERIGMSRSCVYREWFNGRPIALKVNDVRRDKEMLAEMKHEVDVYIALESLQDIFIPRLVLYGKFECIFYCIGFSVVGKPVQELSDRQQDQLLEGLKKIHELDVIHGDIKLQNIIIDDEDTPYWIDFSHAKFQATPEQKKQEMEKFLKLIGKQ